MKIRSITYFCNPRYPFRSEVLHAAGQFLGKASQAFRAAGYDVQTTRLATVPFPRLLPNGSLSSLPVAAQELELILEQIRVEYASLGPALPGHARSYDVIPEAIAASRNIFFAGSLGEARTGEIHAEAARSCAEIIVRCATLEPNGFANLRFAALANVPAGAPFFPAAFHAGGPPSFAIATEAADLAVDAFTGVSTVAEGQAALTAAVQKHADMLTKVSRSVAGRAGKPRFSGIDFSLAPFPEAQRSLGSAFERMGVPRTGLHGSLSAAAILMGAAGAARFKRAGFSGLFMPVLEDAILAQRAGEETLTLKDLLLYSAVCGTGLDTIPLAGDSTDDQITAVLLDLAALAFRLNKPLTARLMPIPNRRAGDATGFDFEYFANSRVMRLDAERVGPPLGADSPFKIRARRA